MREYLFFIYFQFSSLLYKLFLDNHKPQIPCSTTRYAGLLVYCGLISSSFVKYRMTVEKSRICYLPQNYHQGSLSLLSLCSFLRGLVLSSCNSASVFFNLSKSFRFLRMICANLKEQLSLRYLISRMSLSYFLCVSRCLVNGSYHGFVTLLLPPFFLLFRVSVNSFLLHRKDFSYRVRINTFFYSLRLFKFPFWWFISQNQVSSLKKDIFS